MAAGSNELAFSGEIDNESYQAGKFLTFCLGNEQYGIDISHVIEIIGIQTITDLPDMPGFIKGIINLRGKVIPVMDVRARFNMEEAEHTERTCIVVVRISDGSVGLIVDTVSEVLDIPDSEIELPPKVNELAGSHYIRGLGKVGHNVKILLDTQKLIMENGAKQIAAVMEG